MLDRWGRRPFFLLGLMGYFIAMLFFSCADSVTLLTAARIIQGVGQAFLWLSLLTMVADLSEHSGRGHDFGLIDEAASRGGLVGTILGMTAFFTLTGMGLGIHRTWMLLFIAYLLPSGLALWIGWRGARETKPEVHLDQVRSKPLSRQLILLMGIVFITGACTAMVWPLLMLFLQDRLMAKASTLAIAYIPAALINSFLPSRLGSMADRFGRRKLMSLGLIVGGLASVIIPSLESLFGLAVLWSIETVGYCAAMPAERAYVADIAGEDVRGASYGLYTFAYFFGAFLGPLAGGWMYDNLSHASPFYLNAAVLMTGALLVLFLLKDKNSSHNLLTSPT
jgi:MFS family permease